MGARDDAQKDLRRTASDGKLSGEWVEYGLADEALALFLQQVEQAILGRKLSVSLGDGTTFAALAAGRRLIRLLPPAPGGLSSGLAESFSSDELSAKDQDSALAALRAVFKASGRLRILAEPPPERLEVIGDTGLRASSLFEAGGLSGHNPAQSAGAERDIVDAFVAAMELDLKAAVWIEGDETSAVHGDEAAIASLAGWATRRLERLLAPEFPMAAGLETDGIFVFVPHEGAQRVLLGHLGNILAAEISATSGTVALEHWRRLKSEPQA